jgi:hypothetical protein
VPKRVLAAQELKDLTASVFGDLAWLRDTDLGTTNEDGLREASARLRRLLTHDKTLQQLRRALGHRGELRISSPTFTADGSDVVFAQSAGARRGGTQVQDVAVYNRALSPDEVRDRFEKVKEAGPVTQELLLSNWLSSKCMVVNGIPVTRRDVVLFVAHKLGGVHFDTSRDAKNHPGYTALDNARELVRTADLDAAYAELAAIAQQLVSSRDVEVLFRELPVPES